MGKNKTNAYRTKIKEIKRHWICHTLLKPQGAAERLALDCNLNVQGRGVDKENLEKKKRMRTAEDGRKLERSKTTCFGHNQMEELQEGPMFHKVTKGANDDDDESM